MCDWSSTPPGLKPPEPRRQSTVPAFMLFAVEIYLFRQTVPAFAGLQNSLAPTDGVKHPDRVLAASSSGRFSPRCRQYGLNCRGGPATHRIESLRLVLLADSRQRMEEEDGM